MQPILVVCSSPLGSVALARRLGRLQAPIEMVASLAEAEVRLSDGDCRALVIDLEVDAQDLEQQAHLHRLQRDHPAMRVYAVCRGVPDACVGNCRAFDGTFSVPVDGLALVDVAFDDERSPHWETLPCDKAGYAAMRRSHPHLPVVA